MNKMKITLFIWQVQARNKACMLRFLAKCHILFSCEGTWLSDPTVLLFVMPWPQCPASEQGLTPRDTVQPPKIIFNRTQILSFVSPVQWSPPFQSSEALLSGPIFYTLFPGFQLLDSLKRTSSAFSTVLSSLPCLLSSPSTYVFLSLFPSCIIEVKQATRHRWKKGDYSTLFSSRRKREHWEHLCVHTFCSIKRNRCLSSYKVGQGCFDERNSVKSTVSTIWLLIAIPNLTNAYWAWHLTSGNLCKMRIQMCISQGRPSIKWDNKRKSLVVSHHSKQERLRG